MIYELANDSFNRRGQKISSHRQQLNSGSYAANSDDQSSRTTISVINYNNPIINMNFDHSNFHNPQLNESQSM